MSVGGARRAGTTVDPVDSLIEMYGKICVCVDTADCGAKSDRHSGLVLTRRAHNTARSIRPRSRIVLIDASHPLTEQPSVCFHG